MGAARTFFVARYRLGFAVALLVFALDQLLKWIVTGPMGLTLIGDEHYFLPIFSFTLTHNEGISLGLLKAHGRQPPKMGAPRRASSMALAAASGASPG